MTGALGQRVRSFAMSYAVLVVLAALTILLSVATPNFLTTQNLSNLLQQVSMVGVIAMGMTMLLISRNFDLSVGGIVVLSSVVGATVVNTVGTTVGVACTLALGALLGAINGLVVTRLRVNSLVATLGTGLVFGGMALVASGAAPVILERGALRDTVGASVGGFPVAGLIFLAVIAASTWFLHATVGGRRLFAIGANPPGALYAGIPVNRTIATAFTITGFYAGIAATILMGLLNSASPGAATTWPLDVIAAAVVGGVSIAGGHGSTGMAVIGVLLIGMVGNGFNLLDIDPNYRSIFTGVVIVGAVAVDQLIRRSGETRLSRSAKSPSQADSQRPLSVDAVSQWQQHSTDA